ncbi:MAG: DUF4258 domain-containing protein [bacterium]
MTAEEAQALADAYGFASAGRIVMSRHAEARMEERGASFADVRQALVSATSCHAQPDERWRIEGGCDGDGDALTVVVTFEGSVVVVTLF